MKNQLEKQMENEMEADLGPPIPTLNPKPLNSKPYVNPKL